MSGHFPVYARQRKGAAERAADPSRRLSAIPELYRSRTLPLVSGAALQTGRVLDRAMAAASAPRFEDAAIAAVNDLTVVTANEWHFEHFGVAFISPPIT